MYDIIDPTDHAIMRSNLVPPTSTDTGKAHFSMYMCAVSFMYAGK